MLQQIVIDKLKDLIFTWEEENLAIQEMCSMWEDHSDPMSDPGLQFEQEQIRDQAFDKLILYCQSLKTNK